MVHGVARKPCFNVADYAPVNDQEGPVQLTRSTAAVAQQGQSKVPLPCASPC